METTTKENFDAFVQSDPLTPYTWVYRLNSENEFKWDESSEITTAKDTLRYNDASPEGNYLVNILSRHPSIVVYHKDSMSKVKHCHDAKHFHISFHKEHPSNLHSFQMLKNILKHKIAKPYTMNSMKVCTPFGFCKYLNQDSAIKWVICADNINYEKHKAVLNQLTDKALREMKDSDDSETESVHKTETVRGHKYDFIKKCNSIDLGDIIHFCNNSNKLTYANTWKNISQYDKPANNIISSSN